MLVTMVGEQGLRAQEFGIVQIDDTYHLHARVAGRGDDQIVVSVDVQEFGVIEQGSPDLELGGADVLVDDQILAVGALIIGNRQAFVMPGDAVGAVEGSEGVYELGRIRLEIDDMNPVRASRDRRVATIIG